MNQIRPDLNSTTAGTLVVEGLPLSVRTRAAFEAIGLRPPPHRSRQADGAILERASLVIGFAPEHVHWVRRHHPEAAGRTATLIHLVRHLTNVAPGGPPTLDLGLDLGIHAPGEDEEILDPGGGPTEVYVEVAHQIRDLVVELGQLL